MRTRVTSVDAELSKLVSRGTCLPAGSMRRACRIGGEWFHLTPGVRAVIMAAIADEPDRAGPLEIDK